MLELKVTAFPDRVMGAEVGTVRGTCCREGSRMSLGRLTSRSWESSPARFSEEGGGVANTRSDHSAESRMLERAFWLSTGELRVTARALARASLLFVLFVSRGQEVGFSASWTSRE